MVTHTSASRPNITITSSPASDQGAHQATMAMTMTISNNSSAKRITEQIPTSSRDATEARVIVSVRPSSVVSVEFALRSGNRLMILIQPGYGVD